jgi:adenylate cyclase, class 2
MSNQGQEIEAKFYVLHLGQVMTRLQELEARLIQPRVLESNLRFDLADGRLRSQGHVLRLRHDTKSRLTYKGTGQNDGGIRSCEEIEFTVDDFEKAKRFLHALGYQQVIYYEKYRTTYELNNTLIMLDELPYGDFVEIEGETAEQIRTVAEKLNINWGTAIERSYVALFENVRSALQLSFQEISFQSFNGIQVSPDVLKVHPADSST